MTYFLIVIAVIISITFLLHELGHPAKVIQRKLGKTASGNFRKLSEDGRISYVISDGKIVAGYFLDEKNLPSKRISASSDNINQEFPRLNSGARDILCETDIVEAKAIWKFSDGNIVSFYSILSIKDHPYIWIEWKGWHGGLSHLKK